jgi:hypothetical protein
MLLRKPVCATMKWMFHSEVIHVFSFRVYLPFEGTLYGAALELSSRNKRRLHRLARNGKLLKHMIPFETFDTVWYTPALR